MSAQPSDIRPPVLVTAREHLEEVVSELKRFPVLGFDTESNGFYAHHEKVCLIQISSTEADYILDPIAVRDIKSLGPIFADPGIEKIFHAAEYDIIGLKRDYGFQIRGLFDTMIAARFLGWKELGLAKAVEASFGVVLSKKLQRADWSRRPLTEEHLRYAQLDTYYLIELAKIQRKLLAECGRWEEAQEAFGEMELTEAPVKAFDPEAYRFFAGARDLPAQNLGALREIYLLREEEAQRKDLAPFRVLSESLMLRLAAEMPQDRTSLSRVKGMTSYLMERLADKILSALRRGREKPADLAEPRRPGMVRRDMRSERLFEKLRQWRKAQALEENLDPGTIISATILKEVVRLALAGEEPLSPLGPAKRARYEASLRRILNEPI